VQSAGGQQARAHGDSVAARAAAAWKAGEAEEGEEGDGRRTRTCETAGRGTGAADTEQRVLLP
jgi:hypothetical protein